MTTVFPSNTSGDCRGAGDPIEGLRNKRENRGETQDLLATRDNILPGGAERHATRIASRFTLGRMRGWSDFAVVPDVWMTHATGSPVSAGPLLKASEEALRGL